MKFMLYALHKKLFLIKRNKDNLSNIIVMIAKSNITRSFPREPNPSPHI